MHPWPTWLTASAGLAAGAALIACLPEHSLFTDHATGMDATADTSGSRWACPMMDFIGNRPGLCPVCGMRLTQVVAGELTAEQSRRIGLETAVVRAGPALMTVRAYGTVDYDHRHTQVVLPRIAGRIVLRHAAALGLTQSIAVGTPLVDVYSPEVIIAQGEILAAHRSGDAALVARLRERFSRWNLEALADEVLSLGAIRETVTLRSPFAGQVLQEDFSAYNADLQVGRDLQPDTPLLRVADPDRIVLRLQLPEASARWVAPGQKVTLASDDGGDLPHISAQVDRVSPEISPLLRTRELLVFLHESRRVLAPGALVSARIQAALGPDLTPASPDHPASWGRFILVPKEAVLSTGVRHVVWRQIQRSGGGATHWEAVAVALGPRLESADGADAWIIRAGLNPGDTVATRGAFLIDSQAQLAGTPSLLFPSGSADAAPAAHAH